MAIFITTWHFITSLLVSGCTVNSQAGDGTKQGTCDREHLCHADGTCKSEGS